MAFRFRSDGWLNMTKAAQHFGKRLQHFFDNDETGDYMSELAALTRRNSGELTQATPGRYGGTWAHPKVVVPFSRWLDVRFAVLCDAMIEDIIKGAAEVTITKREMQVETMKYVGSTFVNVYPLEALNCGYGAAFGKE